MSRGDQREPLVGSEETLYGGIGARWYVSTGKQFPIDGGWCFLELAGGGRLIELDVGNGSWDPFHREAKKVLTGLTPA
jgi:hypothetical protein